MKWKVLWLGFVLTPFLGFSQGIRNSLGETFTAGLAGSLTKVDVFIARNELR